MQPSDRAEPQQPDGTAADARAPVPPAPPVEIAGRKGPDPTRYGDWEKDGRCIDF